MVNLINFKELFKSWSYTKTEEKNLFKSELSALKYIDGCLYWGEPEKIGEVLYAPQLNGDDEITSWTTLTNKTENGIFYTHGSFLTEGWSNEGLWQLDFDCMTTSWWYVGLMPLCSEEINPYDDAKNTSYSMVTWEGITYPYGLNYNVVSEDSLTKITTTNVWHHITIRKLSSTQIETIINETYCSIRNVPNLANLTTLHIGSRDNPSTGNRNKGGVLQLKNIRVISIDE